MTIKASSSSQISKCKAKFSEVIASPGAGKTHTLLMRLLHLIGIGVPAERILVLSFSRASVAELRRRLKAMPKQVVGKTSNGGRIASRARSADMSKVTIKTAHAFALGLIHSPQVLSDKAACTLLGKAIKSARASCQKRTLWPNLSPAINHRRLALLDDLAEAENRQFVLKFLAVVQAAKWTVRETTNMAQFEGLEPYVNVLRAVRAKFALLKKKARVIDYGDMLDQAVRAIDKGATVPFTHILVDEYQDCSPAQVQLLARLATLEERSIMVFGDPCQAIFGFGGASYTPLSSVLDGVQELSLPMSRRLTAQNAALASAVVGHGADQAIQTNRDGEMPALVRDDSLAAQTKHIVQDIQQLIGSGVPRAEIVVLGRTKALLVPAEQSLLATGVQTSRMGLGREQKHALRVLRLINLVAQSEKSKAAVTTEMLRKAFSRLIDVDDDHWKKASRALKKVSRTPSLEGRYRLCAKIYLRLRGGVREDAELRADVNRWETVCRAHVDARSMRDAIRAMDVQAVATGTIHAAKGREWNHVFVVGVTDGLLPLYLARDNKHALGEERNLLYVAITRACKAVRLYHAPTGHARSRQRFEKLSCFLGPAVLKTLQVE